MTTVTFPDPPLTVNEVMLRRWCERDVSAIVEACSDPVTVRFIPNIPTPYAEREARDWLATHERKFTVVWRWRLPTSTPMECLVPLRCV